MKQIVVAIMACALIFACTPEDKNNGEGGGNQNNQDELTNNQDELTVTFADVNVAGHTATLVGYANLPLKMGNAQVGIVYATKQSFEDCQMVAATGWDGSNVFIVTVTGLSPNTTYYYKSYVQEGRKDEKYGEVLSFTTKELIVPAGAVDLGIERTRADGTIYTLYWATSNLGEDGLCPNPEDYGDYYAWGETAPYYSNQNPLTWKDGKMGYSWRSYKWSLGSEDALTKYNNSSSSGIVDNKTEFRDYNYEDDAARQALGGKWRIPTEAEWTELLKRCTMTWTTQNGVNGVLVKSKTNGNSIFLPAAGFFSGISLHKACSYGIYWSSSLGTYWWKGGPHLGLNVYFNSTGVYSDIAYRYEGFPVRPVTE